MSLIGRKIGRLQVIANSSRKGFVICKCDCGNVREVRVNNLTRRSKQQFPVAVTAEKW